MSFSILEGNQSSVQILRLLTGATLFVMSGLQMHGQAFITNHLVAHYIFSGSPEDDSGNGLTGVPSNIQYAEDRFGIAGAACLFNGIDSRITVMPSPLLKLTNTLTASFWIKGNTAGRMLLCKGISDLSYSIGCDLDRKIGLNKQGIVTIVKTTSGLPTESWTHVAVTLDTNSARIYLNGLLTASAPSTSVNAGEEPLSIGSVYGGGQNYGGLIDDIRLYNRSLSAQEVAQLFAYESSPQPCFPRRAKATATINGDQVASLSVTFGGCGYSTPPAVTIYGGGGDGASGVAVLQSGRVQSLNLITGGSGYTSPPSIRIDPPPFSPRMSISYSKVRVSLEVTTGLRYQLQHSDDLQTWSNAGSPFTATADILNQEYDAENMGRYFRLQQIP